MIVSELIIIMPFHVSSPCLPEKCDTATGIYLADFDNEMVTILSHPSGHQYPEGHRYRARPYLLPDTTKVPSFSRLMMLTCTFVPISSMMINACCQFIVPLV